MAKPKTQETFAPITFTRADPAALEAFDPKSKICIMNCGPHRDDPRSDKERMLLCGDCCLREDYND